MTKHGYGWWVYRYGPHTGRVWANSRFLAQHEAVEQLVSMDDSGGGPLAFAAINAYDLMGDRACGFFTATAHTIDVYPEQDLVCTSATAQTSHTS